MVDALAVFVKTPGLSPVKTRLARDIGVQQAEKFYRLSCATTQDLMRAWQEKGGTSFWAVAERPDPLHAAWKEFPILLQGEGELGTRLHNVYTCLSKDHHQIFLIGADTPQLTTAHLRAAQAELEQHDFVFGPARDGGFYLFGGRKLIAHEIWQSVAYSRSDTREKLAAKLQAHGSIKTLPTVLTDVDTGADLAPLRKEMGKATTKAQEALLSFLELPAFSF